MPSPHACPHDAGHLRASWETREQARVTLAQGLLCGLLPPPLPGRATLDSSSSLIMSVPPTGLQLCSNVLSVA